MRRLVLDQMLLFKMPSVIWLNAGQVLRRTVIIPAAPLTLVADKGMVVVVLPRTWNITKG